MAAKGEGRLSGFPPPVEEEEAEALVSSRLSKQRPRVPAGTPSEAKEEKRAQKAIVFFSWQSLPLHPGNFPRKLFLQLQEKEKCPRASF